MSALVRICIAIGCTLSALASSLRAGVLVVQSGSLQAAIDTAVDGDVLLVSGGPYGQCSIVGKSLSIVADPTGSVTTGPLLVTNLAASQQCTFAGFVVQHQNYVDAIRVTGCTGSVRFEDIRVDTANGTARPALRVEHSADVAVVRCELHGSDALYASSSCCGGNAGGGSDSNAPTRKSRCTTATSKAERASLPSTSHRALFSTRLPA